jgi:hypothetical protein
MMNWAENKSEALGRLRLRVARGPNSAMKSVPQVQEASLIPVKRLFLSTWMQLCNQDSQTANEDTRVQDSLELFQI